MTRHPHHRFRPCSCWGTIHLSRLGRDRALAFSPSSDLCSLCVSALSSSCLPLFPVRFLTLNFQPSTLFFADHPARRANAMCYSRKLSASRRLGIHHAGPTSRTLTSAILPGLHSGVLLLVGRLRTNQFPSPGVYLTRNLRSFGEIGHRRSSCPICTIRLPTIEFASCGRPTLSPITNAYQKENRKMTDCDRLV